MTRTSPAEYRYNPKRALAKMVAILLMLAALGWAVVTLVDDSVLDRVKFDLSLGSLIVLVVAINAASLAVLAILYAAYQWVRRDLKAPRDADDDSR